MNKPLVGITMSYFDSYQATKKGSLSVRDQDVFVLAYDYTKAIEKAGGIPVMLPFVDNVEDYADFYKNLDGFLFTGGEDISPQLYGEQPIFKSREFDPKRDRFELSLMKLILNDTSLPVLAICRGMQMLNVACAGSLFQDIAAQNASEFSHEAYNQPQWEETHIANIKPDSIFSDIYGKDKIAVNTFHHQAVKLLGNDLKIGMLSPDSIVEGIEYTKRNNVFGVQWHPEMLFEKKPEHVCIFEKLVELAKNK